MKLPDHVTHALKGVEHAAGTVGVPGMVVFGWMMERLPALAALVSILWMIFQWYHSEPMRMRRRAQRRRKAKGKVA